MKSNYNNQRQDRHPYDQLTHKRSDDFNILAPSPDFDMSFPDDEDDELSDYTLMENDVDLDYED
jgi:hypothetical protein